MRAMIRFVKRRFDKPVVGVEIGVQYGVNAVSMLHSLHNLKTLHLVDPYKATGYGDVRSQAINVLEPFRDRVVWHFCKSEEAHSQIEDESVDFVYIDGNHLSAEVRKDIDLWLPKVKKGGIIGGHDYYQKSDNAQLDVFVKPSVDQWILECGRELYTKPNPEDWWTIK